MKYRPTTQPARNAKGWLAKELRNIANVLDHPTVDTLTLPPLSAEPDKLVDGMIVFADGTNWNPTGSGAGIYARIGGAWQKL